MRFFLLLFFFSINIYAQDRCKKANKQLKKIDKYVLVGDTEKADNLLVKLQSMCNNPIFVNSIADIYYHSIKDYDNAYVLYLKAYKNNKLVNTSPFSIFNFLKLAYQKGDYHVFEEVVSNANFNINLDDYSEIKALVAKNTFAISSLKDSVYFSPIYLDINSNYDDYFPSMPINSNVLIYTYRDLDSELQDEDFYLSRNIDDRWSNPIKLGANINSDYREGSLSVSLDGKDLFYASCNRPDSYGGCDIYFSTLLNETKWSNSINMGSLINTKYWESQPSISADGNLLFFSSNRYGGYGGADIWVSRKINNIWSDPVNLGPTINSPGDEYTPFLHYDNQTFYFSSKGHPGFGGFDLYTAKINEQFEFDSIVNLGFPINTHYDESGLIVSPDGEKAYFNSNANGNLDIYEFNLPKKNQSHPVAVVNGVILDSINRKGVSCDISIIGLKNDWEYQCKSDNLGQFSFSISPDSKFSITVLSEYHDYFSSNYELQKDETLKSLTIVLNRLNLGNTINLNNIYYNFDDYSLAENSLIEIKKFADYLILNSSLIIEIGGHTDNIGSKQYNYQLSDQRAKSVYNALLNYGVPSSQMTYKGYGFDKPVNNDDSEYARLMNRRTEVKIIGANGK
ncbi:MAG: hypothetical protein CMD27_02345 [Flavobacteriales bacterium]|nr:hypothetical protein [Flavobacteriales bacterium]